MIDAGLARTTINQRVGRIVRLSRWAVENELVPPAVHQGLIAVRGLQKGRSAARETGPVWPAPAVSVAAIRPFVARQVWAMVELQVLTGMRPGEVTGMRTCDLDTSGEVWVYEPESHKTAHRGRGRQVHLGPGGQALLRPWLRSDPTAYLFSPKEAVEERLAERRRGRETPPPPRRARSRGRLPGRPPGERYTSRTCHHAVKYGCRRAGIPPWHPHHLRHGAATSIRARFGLEAAQVVLGHAKADVTEVYAEKDAGLARRVAVAIG